MEENWAEVDMSNQIDNMENSVDSVTVHSNSPDREFG